MSYELNHYNIWVKPIFVKAEIEYPFEGLTTDANGAHRGANYEYRFIVDTLRHYFGNDLDFDDKDQIIIIGSLSNAQMKILRGINEDTCDYPVKYGRCQLKFEIGMYTYDAPPCDGTQTCDCRECVNNCECSQCQTLENNI
jgi:hypothetical protein